MQSLNRGAEPVFFQIAGQNVQNQQNDRSETRKKIEQLQPSAEIPVMKTAGSYTETRKKNRKTVQPSQNPHADNGVHNPQNEGDDEVEQEKVPELFRPARPSKQMYLFLKMSAALLISVLCSMAVSSLFDVLNCFEPIFAKIGLFRTNLCPLERFSSSPGALRNFFTDF